MQQQSAAEILIGEVETYESDGMVCFIRHVHFITMFLTVSSNMSRFLTAVLCAIDELPVSPIKLNRRNEDKRNGTSLYVRMMEETVIFSFALVPRKSLYAFLCYAFSSV